MTRRQLFPAFPLLLAALLPLAQAAAQTPDSANTARAVQGLRLREIGPAVMGGRISDIVVHPDDRSTWYVAVGSGNVWKTTNAGVTWTPIFENERSYSIGTLALDPSSPEVVWVGTGENVSGRHVAWGDGVYRSRDGGGSWQRMGLEDSEHIGRILVDPRDGDVVLVAAEGPLWSSGGQRGIYRTTDGGATWDAVLEIDEDTGVTDIERHPTDPDVLYAAAYERRRHTWGFLAGGPGSGLFKSTDGGATWRRITRGLPSGDMGKIGLAVTPADPERVYATIEAEPEERGFYRSDDRGESWARMNDYLSGGTGPHYYQEIEASPTNADLVIQMDVFYQVTRDGGRTFDLLETGSAKHSDNHALWIDPADGRHLLAGTDGGLYESFDQGRTFRMIPNLPISQFYKVALSDRAPFYDVLGGAQDLGTLIGPSRTTNLEGVRNQDWSVPLGADGYNVAFEPGDPDVLYAETQEGNLYRYDRRSDEAISIQPQPAPGDPPERWNWDSPILVSPHDPHRIWFASQRLWRSDDRGDSWTPVSGDLTRDRNRYELPYMDRVQSVDELFDLGAMSQYATVTAVSESPLAEGLLYTGSDDGLVHVSGDGGATWTGAPLPQGVPELSFVNDVEASVHDAGTVFAAFDAHKLGDYRPLLFRSTDRGRTWTSIAGDLPDDHLVWAVQQDHGEPDLLFAATEYGIFFTPDGGRRWHRLGAGVPTIAFRDLKIHRRDEDLVGATFGRGFYVLDDYTPLREIAAGALTADAVLFPVRDAWWYVPDAPMQAAGMPSQGSDSYVADNPPFGALLTYWLDDVPETLAEQRAERERALGERAENVPFPGWEALREEGLDASPKALVLIRDAAGGPVQWVEGPANEGLHRVAWDLRRPAPDAIDLSPAGWSPPWASDPRGPLAPPGAYTAQLHLMDDEGLTPLGEQRSFQVVAVPTLPQGTDPVAVAAFQQETADFARTLEAASGRLGEARTKLRHMRAALLRTPRADSALFADMEQVERALAELGERLGGDPVRGRMDVASSPGIAGRMWRVMEHWDTRMPPTETMRRNLEIARTDFTGLQADLERVLQTTLGQLEQRLVEAGAPWTPGRPVG
jgi:photosystem II stability/assembly factor-like uncharacterized protein